MACYRGYRGVPRKGYRGVPRGTYRGDRGIPRGTDRGVPRATEGVMLPRSEGTVTRYRGTQITGSDVGIWVMVPGARGVGEVWNNGCGEVWRPPWGSVCTELYGMGSRFGMGSDGNKRPPWPIQKLVSEPRPWSPNEKSERKGHR